MNTAKAFPSDLIKIDVKITSGPHEGETFVITKDIFNVGRGAENDIILINDPKLSRNHIKISMKESHLFVENLSTRNPILFKKKLEQQVEIKPMDRIRIGDTEMELSWNATLFEKTLMATEDPTQLSVQRTIATKVEDISEQELPLPVLTEKNKIPAIIPLPAAATAAATAPPAATATPASEKALPNKVLFHPTAPKIPLAPSIKNENRIVKNDEPPKINAAPPRPAPNAIINKSKIPPRFLLIGAGVVLLIIIVIMQSGDKKPKKQTALKDPHQLNAELQKSNQLVENYMKEKKLQDDGRMDRVHESAQSYYIRGFRDYRQGQFSRAIIAFQAALSFDPNHVLAKKYLLQSVKKHSEVVQFNLDQAKRYKEKSNYRLCRSSAKQVIIMALRKDQSDPHYKEGKSLFDDCDMLSKGRF